MENISVLLISEAADVRTRVGEVLQSAVANGLLLVEAGAAARALERALQEPFSCVVVSAEVLDREGGAWLSNLLASPHTPAVIALSPEPRGERALHLLERGVQEYLSMDELAGLPHAIDRALARQRRIRALRDTTHQIACTLVDPLTRVLQRGAMDFLLTDVLSGCHRRGAVVTGLLLDVDDLHQINDAWGHATGDQVLIEVARRLRTLMRTDDLLARAYGDEFLWVLPDTSQSQALALAERVRAAIAARPVATDRGPVPVTASIGVFPVRANAGVDDLCALGTVAVAESKARGHDCVSATWTGGETATWPRGRWPLQMLRPGSAAAPASLYYF